MWNKTTLWRAFKIPCQSLIKIVARIFYSLKNKLEVVKIGSKLPISRTELIRFLKDNTIPAL